MTVVYVVGYAGSGKTEFSKLLSQALSWPLLDKDTLTSPLVDALNQALSGNPNDRSSSIYLNRVRPLEYKILNDVIQENKALGVSMVVTAPYLKELLSTEWLLGLQEGNQSIGRSDVVVWVDCDVDVMKSRIITRDSRRDDSKLENWETYAYSLSPEKYKHHADVVINTSDSSLEGLRELADKIAALLGVF